MRRLITFSLLLFMGGCAGVQLPSSDICVVEAKQFRLLCYNLKNDYAVVNSRVVLKAGAVPHYKPLLAPSDVDKFTCTDPVSWGGIKAWAQALGDQYSNCTCN